MGAVEERARILADDALSLMFPYRTAERLTQDGPQGDDSLLGLERPTRFKGDTKASKLKAEFAERAQAFEAEHESLMHELIPLLPESNRDAERAAESAAIARAEKPASGHKKKRGFGAGGAKSTYFGAGN
jgi:hypothetical protein